jgi:hypothetical protein
MFCTTEILLAGTYSGGDGSENTPYLIANKADLLELSATTDDYGAYFKMTADIDLVGESFTTAVIAPDTDSSTTDFQGTKFTGTFDAYGYKVRNLKITGGTNSYIGLFGYIDGAQFTSTTLYSCDMSGDEHVGSLCGKADASIIRQCSSSGSVSGDNQVGGLCGSADSSTINYSHSSANVDGAYSYIGGICGNATALTIEDNDSTGDVSGYSFVGGLCGVANTCPTINFNHTIGNISGNNNVGGLFGAINDHSTIYKCSSKGRVTGTANNIGGLCGAATGGSTVTHSYSTGDIAGDGASSIGGLCGFVYDSSTVRSCYSTGDITGATTVGGFCGMVMSSSTVKWCYSRGDVICTGDYIGGFAGGVAISSTTENCYSTGYVSGNEYSGGFCGMNDGTTTSKYFTNNDIPNQTSGNNEVIINCLWDVETSSQTNSAGGIGKTTIEMQTQSTFTAIGWDFTNTWIMDDFPVLRSLSIPDPIDYETWLDKYEVPTGERDEADTPAEDGIQNLLKYAIGLDPEEAYSYSKVIWLPSEIGSNSASIVYNKSKQAEDIDIFPIWCNSLDSIWEEDGFQQTLIIETITNETWKASVPMTNGCRYIRLRAKTTE